MYQNNEYPYLYETHMHTNVGSRCGKSSPEEQVKAAKEAGYTGVFVTEHHWGGNSAIDRSLPWPEYVHAFCASYREAKEAGDKYGIQVFFAYEAGYKGTDFLIYGVDEEWLLNHPEIHDADEAQQYKLIKEAGGMVIHAHPFREAFYLKEIRLFPHDVDGVEVYNGSHDVPANHGTPHPEYNRRALAYAKEYGKVMTAGSDTHYVESFVAGVAFKEKLTSVQDYIDAVLNGGDYILVNNGEYFDTHGTKL